MCCFRVASELARDLYRALSDCTCSPSESMSFGDRMMKLEVQRYVANDDSKHAEEVTVSDLG